MGLRSLSMSPAFVPSIKEIIRRTSQSISQKIAERVLSMRTLGEVRGYLTRQVRHLWPNVTLLDMSR
jgi:phosphoenolpyruvate-protein kinase (PTS system EI component)